MKTAILLSLTLLVGGCQPAAPKAPAPLVKQKQQLKVVTFNVNFSGVDMAKAARVLRKTDADVVALQETTPAWEQSLRRRLRGLYPVQRYRHAGGAGGLAFLSKYPLNSLKVIPPPAQGWFPAWLVQVRTPLGQVLLLNVHLRPPIGDTGRMSSVPSAYFYTRNIRKLGQRRQQQWKRHRRGPGSRRQHQHQHQHRGGRDGGVRCNGGARYGSGRAAHGSTLGQRSDRTRGRQGGRE